MRPAVTGKKSKGSFSLEERLQHGNLDVSEVWELANVSHTKFYEDVKAGRVEIRKLGRRSFVSGPIAKAYIAGHSQAEASAA